MSAKRFGGKYSTGGAQGTPQPPPGNRFDGRRVRRGTGGAKLIYAAAAPMGLAAIFDILGGNAVTALAELASFALMSFGGWMTIEGVKAAQAYEARAVARPPGIPRKIIGAAAIDLGVTIGAFLGWGLDLWQALIMGAVATGAHLFAFGLDPMKPKGLEDASDFDRERVAKAVDRAETLVSELMAAARGIGDRQIEGRVERLATAARAVFRTVEEDPRDLPRARKFMGVYLAGARDATAKFAALNARTRSNTAREDYLALLDDLEASFNSHREALLVEDRSDLDIEIDVLRNRLKHEGLRPDPED